MISLLRIRSYACSLSVILPLVLSASAKDFPLNDIPLPRTMDDLKLIEDVLTKQVTNVAPATVSIDIGGGGSGTGVIVSEDGLILTAAHVSQMIKKKVTVILNDGTELEAETLGLNADVDSAMVRIVKEGSYPYVNMHDGDEPTIGNWVFAMGHPGGFDRERGPVVRLGRVVRSEATAFQSDCKLIGGDSGGPLFNMEGNLIAIHSRVGQTKENNMHVPLSFFREDWVKMLDNQFIDDLSMNGLGPGSGPFTFPNYTNLDVMGAEVVDDKEGLLIVAAVLPDSVASKAGLKEGDVISTIEETEVRGRQSLIETFVYLEEQEKISMKVLRVEKEDEEPSVVELTLDRKKKEEKE